MGKKSLWMMAKTRVKKINKREKVKVMITMKKKKMTMMMVFSPKEVIRVKHLRTSFQEPKNTWVAKEVDERKSVDVDSEDIHPARRSVFWEIIY